MAASPREGTSVPLAIVKNTLFLAALVGQRDNGAKDSRVAARGNEFSVRDRQKTLFSPRLRLANGTLSWTAADPPR